MGHLQPATIGPLDVDAVAPEQKKVQIEFAWTPALPLTPAERLFDHLERGQESQRAGLWITARRRLQGDYGVEEVRLVGHAHRACPVHPRHPPDASARQGIKGANRTRERGTRVADV